MSIGITMGDANGVGPELILKAYRDGALTGDWLLIGDAEVLEYCNEHLGYGVDLYRIQNPEKIKKGALNILDMGLLTREDVSIGQVSKAAGYASKCYVERASALALEGRIDAMVTLPVNKEAVRLSDEHFTGHTELIAEMCGQEHFTMMLASSHLRVTHVTTHVSMREAVDLIQRDRVYRVIEITHDTLKRFIDEPKIAVAGLNPHAGENGSFGREELEEIEPAVQEARAKGMEVYGPLPPDTVFLKAYRGQFDAVVCMYHDQGHIPMKLLDFEGGVNITLGLKVIRTSVDHGTAFDIAYQGVASTRSLVQAYEYALNLTGQTRKGMEE